MEVIEKPKEPSIWEYIVPDDLAEALVERAESFSREGRLEKSTQAFWKAAELFGQIESFLDVRDWEVEDHGIRENIDEMRETAQLRRKYCLSRIDEIRGSVMRTIQ